MKERYSNQFPTRPHTKPVVTRLASLWYKYPTGILKELYGCIGLPYKDIQAIKKKLVRTGKYVEENLKVHAYHGR